MCRCMCVGACALPYTRIHMCAGVFHACTCVHACACVCTCLHVWAYMCMCLHVSASICMCGHLCAWVFSRAYVCVCVPCLRVCACLCIGFVLYVCLFNDPHSSSAKCRVLGVMKYRGRTQVLTICGYVYMCVHVGSCVSTCVHVGGLFSHAWVYM